MFSGVGLIAAGSVGWLAGQFYNYGLVEKLTSATELNGDSPTGTFGYVRGPIAVSTPLKLTDTDSRQFASLKVYWFQRLLQCGCAYETRELISGPIFQSADIMISGLRVNQFDKYMSFIKIDERSGADGDGLVTNVGNVLLGNRMRLGTIKETHAVLLESPYLIYGEKVGGSLWPKQGYEDYVYPGMKTHESVIADTERNIGLWNVACVTAIGFGIGLIATAKN